MVISGVQRLYALQNSAIHKGIALRVNWECSAFMRYRAIHLSASGG